MFGLRRRARLAKAAAAFALAQEAYRNAVSRGDCREQFRTHKALKEAQEARLRIEMGR